MRAACGGSTHTSPIMDQAGTWKAERVYQMLALLPVYLSKVCLHWTATLLQTCMSFKPHSHPRSLLCVQLGASHRGHLEAIKRIPAGSARGQLLQQHALAAFLHRVIPGTKVCMPAGHPPLCL